MASDSSARSQASRRDHQRTGATAEIGTGTSGAKDRQQRPDRVEYVVEEGCGMGRARAAAVCDQVTAKSQEDDGVPRLRSVRAVVDGRAQARSTGVRDGAVGW